jgi:WD40 repeat protein
MIKIWDPSSGKCLKVLTGHRGSINALAMLSETELVSGSSDNTIKIWDLLTEDCITLTGHSYGVYALATLPAQRLIFCGAGNGVVKLWNISEKLSLTDDKQFVKEKTSNSKAEKTEKFNESSPRTYRLRLSTNFGNLAADAVQEEEIDEKSKDLSFLL